MTHVMIELVHPQFVIRCLSLNYAEEVSLVISYDKESKYQDAKQYANCHLWYFFHRLRNLSINVC
jgi:hypothetical protein